MNVETTFFFVGIFPPPATSAKILAWLDRSCTRCATDAYETSVVKDIVGNLFLFDIIFDLFCCPEKDRMVFDNLVGFVPFQSLEIFTIWGMFCPQTCDPNFVAF